MEEVEIPEISVQQLAQLIEQSVTLIDVRSPQEYEEGHVRGARLIPLDQIESRAQEVPSDREVYLICRSGGRSARAVQILNQHGRKGINVAGGTLGWIEAGNRVVKGSSEG